MRNEIENIFNSANLIIINEDSDNYIGPFHAFYRYKNFITEQIKNKKLNKFRIVAEIKSSRGKLLINFQDRRNKVKILIIKLIQMAINLFIKI